MAENLENKTESKDIVLYNGSLAELNSIDPDKQYRIIEELHISMIVKQELVDSYENVRKRLYESDYSGIVNMRSVPLEKFNNIFVEGTPIFKVYPTIQ